MAFHCCPTYPCPICHAEKYKPQLHLRPWCELEIAENWGKMDRHDMSPGRPRVSEQLQLFDPDAGIFEKS